MECGALLCSMCGLLVPRRGYLSVVISSCCLVCRAGIWAEPVNAMSWAILGILVTHTWSAHVLGCRQISAVPGGAQTNPCNCFQRLYGFEVEIMHSPSPKLPQKLEYLRFAFRDWFNIFFGLSWFRSIQIYCCSAGTPLLHGCLGQPVLHGGIGQSKRMQEAVWVFGTLA